MHIKLFQLDTNDLRTILNFKNGKIKEHPLYQSKQYALGYNQGFLDAVKYIYSQMRKEIEDDENRINESISRDRTDAYSND